LILLLKSTVSDRIIEKWWHSLCRTLERRPDARKNVTVEARGGAAAKGDKKQNSVTEPNKGLFGNQIISLFQPNNLIILSPLFGPKHDEIIALFQVHYFVPFPNNLIIANKFQIKVKPLFGSNNAKHAKHAKP
jgi:hypothetical protein